MSGRSWIPPLSTQSFGTARWCVNASRLTGGTLASRIIHDTCNTYAVMKRIFVLVDIDQPGGNDKEVYTGSVAKQERSSHYG